MSYDINIVDPLTHKPIEFAEPFDIRGGNYCVGGTYGAWLNITYNYAPHFYRVLGEGGIRSLYGKTVKEGIPLLANAITELGTETDPDYWNPTEGNARKALVNLMFLATCCPPDAVFEGD